MRVTTKLAMAAMPALMLLAACGDNGDGADDGTGGDAEGEVLGGTITDDMLPLAQVRSQSPSAEISTGTSGSGGSSSATDDAGGEGAATAEDAGDSGGAGAATQGDNDKAAAGDESGDGD